MQPLDADETDRQQEDNQEQLGISDGSTHGTEYPFIDEFSEFLSTVSTPSLKYTLMTYQQRLFAKALWGAENYGGSEAKCKQHLKEIYGWDWAELVDFKDHFTPERNYCEYVLILEHMRQWNEQEKLAKLCRN